MLEGNQIPPNDGNIKAIETLGVKVKVQRTNKKASRHALLVQSAAKKIERHRTLLTLTVAEYRASREIVYAVVDFVNEWLEQHPRSKKMPRVFIWRGARYWIGYSTFGRVYVSVPGSKARFPSAAFVI